MLEYRSVLTPVWKLDELDKIIDEFDSAVSDYVKIRDIKYDFDFTNILLTMAGKSIVTIREIICLSTFGYPDGALSLSRNLYEQFIILVFFDKKRHSPGFPKIVENYYHNYEIQRLKNTKAQYELIDDKKRLAIASKEYDDYKQSHNLQCKSEYWWADVNPNKKVCTFKDLADTVIELVDDEKIKFLIMKMHVAYKRACVALHAGCLGNQIRLGYEQDPTVIDTSPTEKGHSFPLWLSTISIMLIVEAVCTELHIDDSFHDRLFDLVIFYAQKKNEEDGS